MQIDGRSDIGLVRDENQDAIFYAKNDRGEAIAVVCDGIGGGNAGDIASSMGVSIIKTAFMNRDSYPKDKGDLEWLIETVDCANKAIYQEASQCEDHRGMGTTLVGALINEEGTYLFHLGDSRAYALSNDQLIMLTQDHNLASDLVKAGEIKEEEAEQHPRGSLLTNALGIWPDAKVDVNKVNNDYDYLLLCSDGLHGYVDEENIIRIITSNQTNSAKVDNLIEQSKLAGGFDNVSVILIDGGEQ